MYRRWPCPERRGGISEESALVFAKGRDVRVLVLPPLFDEYNKYRRQLVVTMRLLDHRGIDSVLPDLPGWNDSLAPLAEQTLAIWRTCAEAAAEHFAATHVLATRSGGWLAPPGRPGWHHAPVRPPQVLRAMLRARTLAAREAERQETIEGLLAHGRETGLVLGGWPLGAEMIRELEMEAPDTRLSIIAPDAVPGRPLWLRAEPDFDAAQAEALARLVHEVVGR